MNGGLLGLGLILGLLFAGVMIFGVLPNIDHMVKRDYGIVEAIVVTRICALLIALPLAMFTIWMTVVIVVDGAKGIALIQDVCPEEYGCTNIFALGRTNHDLTACRSFDCGEENIHARSGSQPLGFPNTLGLGKELTPKYDESILFECFERAENGACIKLIVNADTDRVCNCGEDDVLTIGGHSFCSNFGDCLGDIEENTRVETCQEETNGICTSFTVETDSAKQFTLQSCQCGSLDTFPNCEQFICDTLTVEYFYPNTLYALMASTLFILPATAIGFYLLKVQGRKLLPCATPSVTLYDQSAGVQEAPTAEDVRTGGFYVNQAEKGTYRGLNRWDLPRFIAALGVIVFFTTLDVQVAGRVGLSISLMPFVGIILYEIYQFRKLRKDQADKIKKTMKRVKGHTAGASL